MRLYWFPEIVYQRIVKTNAKLVETRTAIFSKI
jgi:hypothetical protein